MTAAPHPRSSFRIRRRGDDAELELEHPGSGLIIIPLGPAEGPGPLRELALYAVESELGIRRGYFGTVATGDIRRTPGTDDFILSDAIAGVLMREALGERRSEEAFNLEVAAGAASRRVGARAPRVPDSLIEKLRTVLAALRRRWSQTPPGEALELRWT